MKEKNTDFRAFLSVLLIIGALFSIVFCKMEVRRMGYEVWKITKQAKRLEDNKRSMSMEFAKLTRPERVEKYAQKYLALHRAEKKQIIQMDNNSIAFQRQ